jgi:predicted Rossmann fold nucleotide-binding protein DprA/Smf involved in DNA uptake
MTAAPVLEKIVSGGQTGVDRAALDVALEAGFPCGGWAPKGRMAEDGAIPRRYPLKECSIAGNAERTRLNVRDSDATLILTRGEPEGGTLLTIEWASRLSKPTLVVDLAQPTDPGGIADWLEGGRTRVLNVAGPRESTVPGIGAEAAEVMKAVLDIIQQRS